MQFLRRLSLFFCYSSIKYVHSVVANNVWLFSTNSFTLGDSPDQIYLLIDSEKNMLAYPFRRVLFVIEVQYLNGINHAIKWYTIFCPVALPRLEFSAICDLMVWLVRSITPVLKLPVVWHVLRDQYVNNGCRLFALLSNVGTLLYLVNTE